MTNGSPPTRIKLRELAPGADHPFQVTPDAAQRKAIADQLDLSELRKATLTGRLSPLGASDWRLTATIGATVVQPCVVTLDPVVTRIDQPVERQYLANWSPPEAAEVEMTEDESIEALPATIDLLTILTEALALHLPDYPRADGLDAAKVAVAPPGVQPLTDEDVKPFAGLAGLRDKLGGSDPSGDT